MNPEKQAFLAKAGFESVRAADFLGLSIEQETVVEVKILLSYLLKRIRKESNLTQAALAERLNCPQQNIARMEKGHRSVTIDLLMRALLSAGASMEQITRTMQDADATLRDERRPAPVVRRIQLPPAPNLADYQPYALSLSRSHFTPVRPVKKFNSLPEDSTTSGQLHAA